MYALRCLLPYDRYVVIENHAVVECAEFDSHTLSGDIVFYDTSGSKLTVSTEELSKLLAFNYVDGLYFVHEKILREAVFSMNIPDANEHETFNEMFSTHCICPNISVRHIGIVNGIDVGYGVFAETAIPPNEWIGEYVGVVQSISSSEYLDNSADAYAFLYPGCNSAFEINALEYGNVIRFVNHSSRPNAEFRRLFFGGLWHIVVVRCLLLVSVFVYHFYTVYSAKYRRK